MTDPITLEVIRNRLDAIAEEMELTLLRTSHSPIVKEALDASAALFDGGGQQIAQAAAAPIHLGMVIPAVRRIVELFPPETMRDGDVYLLNDPFEGGSHLPDLIMLTPVIVDGETIALSLAVTHHQEIGGRSPGSTPMDATEIYQEGLRIPPVKLYERGQPVEALFDILAKNVRVPRMVLGDVRAQAAACLAGERGYLALIERYGVDELASISDALLDQAERLARNAIGAMPDGTYRFVDHIDEDGLDPDPIRIEVAITVAGDRLIADFAGSARQVRGAINSPIPYTKSTVYACVRHLIGGDPPNNEGYFRPIEVRAPPGTVVNPVLPASVAARGLTGFRIANAVFGALAQIAPDRVFACESGGDTGVSFGGYHPDGRPFVFIEFLYGSWGGRPHLDGVDACSSSIVNFSNNPVEIIEAEQPLLIREYGYVPDTGGAGEFRGGLALSRAYQFETPEATFQLRTDRRRFVPYGLSGGRDGTPSSNILDPDGAATLLPTKTRLTVHHGDVLRHQVAGAGGWGDPLARDPARVLHDVCEEKLSVAYARREYGVVIDESGLAVDEAATARLRSEHATARNAGR